MAFSAFVPVTSSLGTDHPGGGNNMFPILNDSPLFFLFSKTSSFHGGKVPTDGSMLKFLITFPYFSASLMGSHVTQF